MCHSVDPSPEFAAVADAGVADVLYRVDAFLDLDVIDDSATTREPGFGDDSGLADSRRRYNREHLVQWLSTDTGMGFDEMDVDTIWMDGEYVDWDEAQVHVLTHGLHYGSGVFEGARCYDTEQGRPSSAGRNT